MRPGFARPETWFVLVVDDEPVVLRMTVRLLEGLVVDGVPLQVHACESAAVAEQQLASASYAVAIVDLVMETERSGLDLIESMHRDPRHQLTQIVVRTGDASVAPEPELVRRLGIADYWHKGGVSPQRVRTLVTGLVRAHAAARSLQIEQRYLGTLLGRLPNTVLHVRESGHIDFCNRDGGVRDGLFREGTNLADHLKEASLERLQEPLRRACLGELPDQVEVRAGELDFEVRLGPSPGGTLGAVLILTELSERRAWEASLVVRGKLDVVARMAGEMAHQLNNSLTAVMNSVVMARDTVKDDPLAVRHLDTALQASQRMEKLSRDLLSLTRENNVKGDVVDVIRHIQDSERRCRTVLGERVHLELELADTSLGVRVSSDIFDQILLNLLHQVRIWLAGGGRVRLAVDAIDLRRTLKGDDGQTIPVGPYVRIVVEHDGPGLSQEERRHIYEPFHHQSVGDGPADFGLSLVYLGVQRLGGSIWVQSPPGQGTRIQLALPRVASMPPRSEEQDASPAVSAPLRTGGVVLLVEDDSLVRKAVAGVLEKAGFEVLQAEDVKSANAALVQEVDRLDLLLSDIRLPDGQGFEVVDRGRELRPGLPVMMMSGFAGFARDVREIPDVYFLRKPFEPAALLTAVQQVLQDGRTDEGPQS
jgi:signal transduction histidine kinase